MISFCVMNICLISNKGIYHTAPYNIFGYTLRRSFILCGKYKGKEMLVGL